MHKNLQNVYMQKGTKYSKYSVHYEIYDEE